MRGNEAGGSKEKFLNPNVNLLKTKYHEKLKEYKRKCKSKRYNFWQSNFNDIENSLGDSKTFWRKWKNASEHYSNTKVPDITGQQWYDHFSKLHTETREGNDLNFRREGVDKVYQDLGINEPFTEKEFMSVIKNLKNCKAAGFDGLPNEILKNSPKVIHLLLLKFINLCLTKCLITQSWCKELINPIFKDGLLNDPNNYRGICISSALLKIICSLLNNRVQAYCNRLNLINKNQIGFKSKHRTADHLLTLKAVVKKYVTVGKKKLHACFIDFKKAFDSVWHEGLFYKVEKCGISGNFLDLIRDLYKKTNCAIKIGESITDFFDYAKGVRQGCPLSPILFNIYVNDIFELMNNNNENDITLGQNKLNALMYADDLILLAETENGLQKQIDKLLGYCQKWKLDVNIKKTKLMVFNRGNKLLKRNVKINNTVLESVKTFKYLGFSISAKNCSFAPTIEDLSVKANRAIYALNNRNKISKLPAKLALKLFQAQIAPILLYGAEVWGPYMDYDYISWEISKIERVQTQFLKRVLGCNIQSSNIMVRGEVGVRPLLVDIIGRVVSFVKSIRDRLDSTVYSAYDFELNNETSPNFCKFVDKFNFNPVDIFALNKRKLKKICEDNYDRHWWEQICISPKAIAYMNFKRIIKFEDYLLQVCNNKHKKTLSRFRLSNHPLMIEKGRHMRPRIERNERKCFNCKTEVEDECHFVTKCPLYATFRECLYITCKRNSKNFASLTDEQKFIFILSNEDIEISRALAKFLFRSFKIRESAYSAIQSA